jgi:hypothetical protein
VTEAEARNLKRMYSRQLLAVDAVSGVGVTKVGPDHLTAGSEDNFVVTVFLSTEETPTLRSKLSHVLDGHEFMTLFTGRFRPFDASSTSG